MALRLDAPVRALPGIGLTAEKDFKALGIVSIGDLLWHLPYRYDDFSASPPIPSLKQDDTVTIVGVVRTITSRVASKNRKLSLTEAIIENETGALKATWFNQTYLLETLKPGTRVSLAGRVDTKYGTALANPVWELAGQGTHTGRLVPIYGLSGSLTPKRVRSAMKAALPAAARFEEWLPDEVVRGEDLPAFSEAITEIHFPSSAAHLERAANRIKFDELFIHQMFFQEVHRARAKRTSHAFPIDEAFLKSFVAAFPFTLTNAQRRAAWEIVQDTAKDEPMNRLLQGDVGSGKTAVAAIVLAHAAAHGALSAYLAPTELLAFQQHGALTKFLGPGTALLTSSTAMIGSTEVARNDLAQTLEAGEIRVLTGTHALLQEGFAIPPLHLVVIDEQHRFGVAQRHALLERGQEAPHLLSMTATPIPRSLALAIYGDLDVSVLNELPKGRKPIETRLVFEKERAAMWKEMRARVDRGEQAYVVCPLIEASERSDGANATEIAERLKKGPFKGTKIGLLHGKLKSDEKTDLLLNFRDGKIDVLVSTTVVEVGVDVPNATAMVVLGAERFGLAQLHQLRGRVGRGEAKSICYLAPDGWSSNAKERLLALVRSQDGFALAEKDLALRGAGNVFGNAQSGFPDFKLATPADVDLMKRARTHAEAVRKSDPELTGHPLLKSKIRTALERVHME